MSPVAVARVLFFYVLAVIVATVLATLVQTQVNLQDLEQLDVTISSEDRIAATLSDLRNFTPLMGLLVAVSFALALPAAEAVARLLGTLRPAVYMLAGAVGIWVAFRITDAVAPPPTFIAATREWPGTLAMMAAVALGSGAFSLWTRGRSRANERHTR